MNEKIAQLNVVIAELNLTAAKLANGEPASSVAELLADAKLHLAQATRSITGQSAGADDTN